MAASSVEKIVIDRLSYFESILRVVLLLHCASVAIFFAREDKLHPVIEA